jgi:hypothetical protein
MLQQIRFFFNSYTKNIAIRIFENIETGLSDVARKNGCHTSGAFAFTTKCPDRETRSVDGGVGATTPRR